MCRENHGFSEPEKFGIPIRKMLLGLFGRVALGRNEAIGIFGIVSTLIYRIYSINGIKNLKETLKRPSLLEDKGPRTLECRWSNIAFLVSRW